MSYVTLYFRDGVLSSTDVLSLTPHAGTRHATTESFGAGYREQYAVTCFTPLCPFCPKLQPTLSGSKEGTKGQGNNQYCKTCNEETKKLRTNLVTPGNPQRWNSVIAKRSIQPGDSWESPKVRLLQSQPTSV